MKKMDARLQSLSMTNTGLKDLYEKNGCPITVLEHDEYRNLEFGFLEF